MESIWQKEIQKPHWDPLEGDQKTDALIIGGGLSGILCGYMLKQAGIDCLIAEARTICSGTTQNTTAKVTYHHGAIFNKMIMRYGSERAALYVKANEEALQRYRDLSKKLECDLEETVSYVYSRRSRKCIEKEVAALNSLGCPARFAKDLPLPFSVEGAVELRGQAQLHPLKLAYGLAKDLKIFENTQVTEIRDGVALTNCGSIRAKYFIVTTHFPFLNRHGLYFMKLYQHRSYVLALENAPMPEGIYVDESLKGLSFRSYHDLLLLGGGGHRTGKKGGSYPELRAFAEKHYPAARECCHYAAQDCMSLDDIPYIGQYGKHTPTLYVATGFNKWGMTSAMVAASLLCDLIQGKHNDYTGLFSPSRSILHPGLLTNAGESMLGLINPTAPRCSHLGCALHYNKQEHSWDCACHGSRFSREGHLIDDPATKGIKPLRPPKE